MSAVALAKIQRPYLGTYRHDEACDNDSEGDSTHPAAFTGARHGHEAKKEENEVEHNW